MARCGCVGTCTCSVVAGSPNVTITGNGNPGSPYTVSVLTAGEDCSGVMECVGEAVENGSGLTYDPIENALSVIEGPAGAEPRARVLRSTNIDVPPGAGAFVVPLNTVQSNVGPMWTNAVPSRLTIPADISGYFIVGGNMMMQNQGGITSFRSIFIRRNGTDIIAGDQVQSGPNTTILSCSTGFAFDGGDFIELLVDHGEDDPCTLVANTFSPVLWASFQQLTPAP